MKVFFVFLSGAFGVAERTSSFLESFSILTVESASDFFRSLSAFSFNSEVSIAFLDFRFWNENDWQSFLHEF